MRKRKSYRVSRELILASVGILLFVAEAPGNSNELVGDVVLEPNEGVIRESPLDLFA